MYVCERLNGLSSMSYHGLTYPSLQAVLYALGPDTGWTAVGASEAGDAVGLGLALDLPAKGFTRIASLFVQPACRRRGIGKALLARMEDELRERGAERAEISYTTGKASTPAVEALLRSSGWPQPVAERLVCKCDRRMLDAPWLKEFSLHDSYSIVPWQQVTEQQLDELRDSQERDQWIPPTLLPWQYGSNFEPLNSVAMLSAGSIVGWVITQRFSSDTIVYSCSYMRPDLQHVGRILPLYVEAIRRHSAALEIPKAIWVVPFVHASMVRFVRRRLAPFMNSVEELRVTIKSLGKEPPGAALPPHAIAGPA